tara:strand:- start:108 stop:1319 length:1212 start_codon:yes stop_codon:yes gene_type:complete
MTFLSSAKSVQSVSTKGYHRCGDGLYLQVSNQGTKSWLFRYKSPVTKKQREMGLGSYKFVDLAQARQWALDSKKLVIEGKDPIEERIADNSRLRLAQARNLTFKEISEACITSKSHEWKSSKHAQQWNNTLKTYAFPILGELPISAITTDLILKVLEPIWVSKAETASRVRQRIETIWDYAKARSYVTGENPARLRGHLDKILPKTSKVKRVRHHPALPYKQIGAFIVKLRNHDGFSALALEFAILTASRPSEVTGAKWIEFDIKELVWTIPADRMKAGREHRVPLSSRAIEILNSIKSNRNPMDHVFPGLKHNKGLSNNAFRALVKKMHITNVTPHGFRSTFRDWASEEAFQFSAETAELAIAHTNKNKTEAAYRRGDQLERRRELMTEWERYIMSNMKIGV